MWNSIKVDMLNFLKTFYPFNFWMCKIALASVRLFDQLLNFEAGDAFVGGFLSQLVQELAVMLPTL